MILAKKKLLELVNEEISGILEFQTGLLVGQNQENKGKHSGFVYRGLIELLKNKSNGVIMLLRKRGLFKAITSRNSQRASKLNKKTYTRRRRLGVRIMLKNSKRIVRISALLVTVVVFITGTVFFVGHGDKVKQWIDKISGKGSYSFDYSWTDTVPPLVAHAFGGIDKTAYTNSLEAFVHNYGLGHRVFEVDFDLTQPENILVAAHDGAYWQDQIRDNTSSPPKLDFTYDNFMSQKIYDKYTTLDCEKVIDLMIEYPDIYIITDTKYTDEHFVNLQFSQLVECAKKKDVAVLDRIIPQIYNEEMLTWVMDVYSFKSVVFTLYATEWTPQSVYDFCKKSNVKFVTLHYSLVTEEIIELWDGLDITIACHTSNKQKRASHLFSLGVDFMYTDFLTPDMVK